MKKEPVILKKGEKCKYLGEVSVVLAVSFDYGQYYYTLKSKVPPYYTTRGVGSLWIGLEKLN